MATKKYWHYLYVIYYPALDYRFYYGSRITAQHPDADGAYFGSSVSFAQYNDPAHAEYQADAIKIVLSAQYSTRTKKAEKALSHAEAELIRAAIETFGLDLCLNRNVKGRFCLTLAQRRLAVQRARENGAGFVNMSKKQQLEWARIGGRKAYKMKTGVHAMPKERLYKILQRGRETIAQKYAKTYQFRNPAGEIVTIHNLKNFCRQHGLVACRMRNVKAGRERAHKGWRNP